MRRVLLALPLAATLLAIAVAAAAAAPAGGLRFVECLTGKRPVTIEPRTPREGGCKVSQTVALDGEGTGMNHLGGLVASPDGRSLYAVSSRDDAVAVFATRPLRLRECFTTNAELRVRGRRPCRLLPHPGTEDVVSGFNGVHFIAVSPDGRSVYTVSGDDSIATFARAPTGKLTYKGCITGDHSKYGSTRNGSCKPIATATDIPGGLFSGLAGPSSLTISPTAASSTSPSAKKTGSRPWPAPRTARCSSRAACAGAKAASSSATRRRRRARSWRPRWAIPTAPGWWRRSGS